MKIIKSTLIFCSAMLIGTVLFAQSLSVVHADPGGSGDASGSLDAHVTLENVSGSSIDVIASRTQTLGTGHQTFMCFGAGCYAPTTDNTPPVTFASGAVDSTFKITCACNGNAGVTNATVAFYNQASPTDSVHTMFVFSCSTVGNDVEVLSADKPSLSKPYPNPAVDKTTIAYALGSAKSAQISIYDMLGRKYDHMTVSNKTGQVEIQASKFNSGVYFIALQAEGYDRVIKKLVINR